MSLWEDEEEAVDDSEARQGRIDAAEDLWNEKPEVDASLYSMHTFRRMHREGISAVVDGPGRQLRPYVTYIPSFISVDPDNPLLEASPPEGEDLPEVIRTLEETGTTEGNGGDGDALWSAVTRARVRAGEVLAFAEEEERQEAAQEAAVNEGRTRDDFTEETAAIALQSAVRRRAAEKIVRGHLVQTWRKKKDTQPGLSVYENAFTLETQYVPPRLFKRFFPGLKW